MPRPAPYTGSRLARVCQHFGLQQRELAALLGISNALVHQLEAGRRTLTPTIAARLAPFLASVPDAATAAAQLLAQAQAHVLLPSPPPGSFDPGPLEKRRAACLHEAANLRHRLRALPTQAQQAANWAAARPAILAALPPPLPEGSAPTTREEVRLRYVHSWLATVPLALPPAVLAQWHLGHQRALALEAEAAALAALLASA
ncbi:MAG: helix-turn-helix domain-containing protein [Janthinobacterium lividum]